MDQSGVDSRSGKAFSRRPLGWRCAGLVGAAAIALAQALPGASPPAADAANPESPVPALAAADAAGAGHEPLVRGELVAHVSSVVDVADCTASLDGTARYFVSVRSISGADITHTVGRLVGTGSENQGQLVNMFVGDLESQADDGKNGAGCVPARSDGHRNDLGTAFIPAVAGTHTWSMRVLAAGYLPSAPVDLSPFVDGSVCPLGDNAGCSISLGTTLLTPVGLPSTSRNNPVSAGAATPTATPTLSPTGAAPRPMGATAPSKAAATPSSRPSGIAAPPMTSTDRVLPPEGSSTDTLDRVDPALSVPAVDATAPQGTPADAEPALPADPQPDLSGDSLDEEEDSGY